MLTGRATDRLYKLKQCKAAGSIHLSDQLQPLGAFQDWNDHNKSVGLRATLLLVQWQDFMFIVFSRSHTCKIIPANWYGQKRLSLFVP